MSAVQRDRLKRLQNLTVILVNVLCVVLVVVMYISYSQKTSAQLRAQNIDNIANLNRSAANISASTFDATALRLGDCSKYISESKLGYEDALYYIHSINSGGSGEFELIRSDARGHIIVENGDGRFIEANYAEENYDDLREIFSNASGELCSEILYTPEFTDAHSARKSFAFYTYLPIADPDGEFEYCTLMYVLRSADLSQSFQQEGGFADLSTVLVDLTGNYIIGHENFKSDNFFKYLYVFNDLNLDTRKEIESKVASSPSESLYYKNSAGEDCVFVSYRYPKGDWYCISCVPISSFHTTTDRESFTLTLALILASMLVLDITWLSRLNRKLRQSIMLANEANSAKTDFLSRMSHDMRTPLNAVLGFSAIARAENDIPYDVADCLDKIDASGHYLLNLINDVLDMAKIESGKVELHVESVDSPRFLRETSELFKADAVQRGILLKTDFTKAQTPYLVMDRLRCRQIFSNLLSNAIKFSDSGTEIEWTVVDTPAEKGRVTRTAVIRDHGCGMSAEFLEHLFDPFEQEANRRSEQVNGTGLGLSIVKRLVTLMGGEVFVESKLGTGSTFTIIMDLELGEKPVSRESVTAQPSLDIIAGKRVLICEDHPLNQQIALRLLENKKVACELADNGRVGVEKFTHSPVGYYDAVLMDIRMPLMNGLDATRIIRSLDRPDAKTVPIIAMTANAYEDDVKSALNAGMDAHLGKPVEPAKLYDTLAKLISR